MEDALAIPFYKEVRVIAAGSRCVLSFRGEEDQANCAGPSGCILCALQRIASPDSSHRIREFPPRNDLRLSFLCMPNPLTNAAFRVMYVTRQKPERS